MQKFYKIVKYPRLITFGIGMLTLFLLSAAVSTALSRTAFREGEAPGSQFGTSKFIRLSARAATDTPVGDEQVKMNKENRNHANSPDWTNCSVVIVKNASTGEIVSMDLEE